MNGNDLLAALPAAALSAICLRRLGGRLTSDPAITHSSGNARLDAGALTLAKAGSGRYRPTIEDGHAVGSCFPFRIRFEFSD